MSPRDVARFTGLTHVTIINWIKQGRIKASQTKTEKGQPRYNISENEAAKLKLALTGEKEEVEKNREEKKRKKEAIKNRILEIPETEENVDREIKAETGLTRIEAERIIKQELAIKSQRENMLRDGKLVDCEDITIVLNEHYRAFLETTDELIDSWSISFNLTFQQQKKMTDEWKFALDRTWGKIKSGLRQS